MRFRYVSPSVERLRGFTVEEVMAQPFDQVLTPASMHLLQENLSYRVEEFLKGQQGYYVNEVEQPRKDGSTVWTEATTSFQINEGNGHLEVYGVSRDITERKQAQEALREAETRWQFALEGSGDGVWDWNVQSNHVFYSRQWKSMLGYKEDEIGNSPNEWTKRIHPDDLYNVEEELAKHYAGQTPVYISEYRILCKDGTYKWVLDRGKVVQWVKDNTPLRFIGTHTDITQQKLTERQLRGQLNEIEQLQDELRQQALHDPLTGLFNRRHLTETLERELSRVRREEKPTSIVIMDIDLFKKVNDNYGHQVGDKFLIAIADLLRKQVRGSDIACRYGGEEFLLILPGITAQDALKRAEELCEMCREIRIPQGKKDLSVTISMGVATFPTHATSVDELLIKADKALYHSKQSGRNRVTLSST
jgi:diguanylate cyclase (GGDEF)-like protein/PAS domain S-box-containing protein